MARRRNLAEACARRSTAIYYRRPGLGLVGRSRKPARRPLWPVGHVQLAFVCPGGEGKWRTPPRARALGAERTPPAAQAAGVAAGPRCRPSQPRKRPIERKLHDAVVGICPATSEIAVGPPVAARPDRWKPPGALVRSAARRRFPHPSVESSRPALPPIQPTGVPSGRKLLHAIGWPVSTTYTKPGNHPAPCADRDSPPGRVSRRTASPSA
jgi:hypothetical protein